MSNDQKKLLPELLPAPTKAEGKKPAARVEERAQRMLQRFKGLGATASAAVLGAHCTGYGVVDPLPPPPEQCSTAPQQSLTEVQVRANYDRTVTVPRPPVVLRLFDLAEPWFTGVVLHQATVTGGTVTSSTAARAPQATDVSVVIMPDTDTSVLDIAVTLGCGAERATKNYRINYHRPASPSDDPVVEPR